MEQQKKYKDMSKRVTKKKLQRVDRDKENSASSSDEESGDKLKGIVDSESEAEEEPMDQQENNDTPKKKSNQAKPMRVSKPIIKLILTITTY